MPKAVRQDLLLEGLDFDTAARRASRLLLICRYRAGKTGMQPTMIPTACSAMLRFLSALNSWNVGGGVGEDNVRQERNFHQDNGSVRIFGVEDLPHKTCDT